MFDQILLPLDGSLLAECVLPHAVAFSRACRASIRLLHVMEHGDPDGPWIDPLEWQIRCSAAQAYLDEVIHRLRLAGVDTDGCVVEGSAAERILAFVHREGIDLIALSSHGRSGLRRWNISSVVQKIIQHAGTSIMLVRAYQPASHALEGPQYGRILVLLDRSVRAESALRIARPLALDQRARLVLAHAIYQPEQAQLLPLAPHARDMVEKLVAYDRQETEHYFEELLSRLMVDAETHVLLGSSVPVSLHELVTQAGVDLVVLTAHGHSETSRWPYGSIALNFIAYGTTPLLVVQDVARLEQTAAEHAAMQHQGH